MERHLAAQVVVRTGAVQCQELACLLAMVVVIVDPVDVVLAAKSAACSVVYTLQLTHTVVKSLTQNLVVHQLEPEHPHLLSFILTTQLAVHVTSCVMDVVVHQSLLMHLSDLACLRSVGKRKPSEVFHL